jgi:hypothetical protein
MNNMPLVAAVQKKKVSHTIDMNNKKLSGSTRRKPKSQDEMIEGSTGDVQQAGHAITPKLIGAGTHQ